MGLPQDFPYGLIGATILFGFALISSYLRARAARERAIRASLAFEESEADEQAAQPDYLHGRIADLEAENARLEEELARMREELGRTNHASQNQPKSVEALYRRILGIEPDEHISAKDLKSAYRRSVKRYHPDHGGDDGALRLVVEAHDYLQSRIHS